MIQMYSLHPAVERLIYGWHQVRFVLWTGDDTVHCDDAYSDKNTVSGSKYNTLWFLRINYYLSKYFKKVIEIISTLSQQLNKTGLPVLPVQVCQGNILTGTLRRRDGQDLLFRETMMFTWPTSFLGLGMRRAGLKFTWWSLNCTGGGLGLSW